MFRTQSYSGLLLLILIIEQQIVPKLSAAVMLDLERVLDNKPIRPPMISTLAMRWHCKIEIQNREQADRLMVTSEKTNDSATSTSCGTIGAKSSCNTLAFCIILWHYEMGFIGEHYRLFTQLKERDICPLLSFSGHI